MTTGGYGLQYTDFLKTKRIKCGSFGVPCRPDAVNPILFPFQRDITAWAVRKGRAAIFADTGLGKTFMQLEWARLLGKPTLIVAPLSVARQTAREANKINIPVQYARSQSEASGQIVITNYEMVEQFDPSQFGAVVIDESSILKALDGHTRQTLTKMFAEVPYRLCCTATPAPNDHAELGNHAEFLGVCTSAEMKAMFFINANKEHATVINGETIRTKGSNKGGTEWRLKHSAEVPFFEWLASWAIMITKPSDLGYDDNGFILPGLNIYPQFVTATGQPKNELFFTKLHGITDRAETRKRTMASRLEAVKTLIADSAEQWIVWCGLDVESHAAHAAIPGSVEVTGSDTPEHKMESLEAFQDGKFNVLITKPRIAGFGMNFQNAHNMIFFGLNDSWESWYQCIRREYRFGQTKKVNVYVIVSDHEREIYQNIQRKERLAARLRQGLLEHLRDYEKEELAMQEHKTDDKKSVIVTRGTGWTLYNGDSCELLGQITSDSVDLSVYSPPFADLFTYTDSPRDLGNSRNWPEFFQHYKYIISENLRVTKPGRVACVHTSDIPAMASRDGYIGIRDFPGEVIRAYENEGWVFTGRAYVQKNPSAQAIRTKSKALLFVQLRKDSADSRPALIDQVLIFRKPGDNAVPVRPVDNDEMDNETWIEWAHGIWLGINESDTLQYAAGRGEDDEKHICPLQLGTIERCIKLYSNPGELVLSPFAGIGSEGYESLRLGRDFVGIELKPSYYQCAIRNLNRAVNSRGTLFDKIESIDDVASVTSPQSIRVV